MARTRYLPTPSSSTEINGKDGHILHITEPAFTLPPPAMTGTVCTFQSSSVGSSKEPASPYQPASPTSPFGSSAHSHSSKRRRSSLTRDDASEPNREDYSLPPPPTRSRRIIQMKPQSQMAMVPKNDKVSEQLPSAPVLPKIAREKSSTGGKKKQVSAAAMAAKQIKRKVSHSSIERNRRMKMNEEFNVMKQMIPACKDEDMHKLAILQASIEYTRYLEQCIIDLQKKTNNIASNRRRSHDPTGSASSKPDPTTDVEEGDQESHQHRITERQVHRESTAPSYSSESPALEPLAYIPCWKITTADASPQLEPTLHQLSATVSALVLPPFQPSNAVNSDLDYEATEALLLLNTDRRGDPGRTGGRGMSVRDLLTV